MSKWDKFVAWGNRLCSKCNRITIVVLYVTTLIIFATLIFCANNQTSTSSITVSWERPSYTITYDANGGILPSAGGGETSQEQIKLFDNYADLDLPTPTRAGYQFDGWIRSNSRSNYISSSYQRLHVSQVGANIIKLGSIDSYWFAWGGTQTRYCYYTLSFDYYFNTPPSSDLSLSTYINVQNSYSVSGSANINFSGNNNQMSFPTSEDGQIASYGKVIHPFNFVIEKSGFSWGGDICIYYTRDLPYLWWKR